MLLVGVMLTISYLRRTSPAARANLLRQVLWVAGGLLLLLLVVKGLNPLIALAAAAIPVVQRLLTARQVFRAVKGAATGGRSTRGQTSDVSTRFLHVVLDHDSGTMSGRVLAGAHEGRELASLSLEELLELLDECRAGDAQSVSVLESYLDRMHGDQWRDASASPDGDAGEPASGTMSAAEAYEILGLQPGATREDVLQAHRRLMQRNHPDRGGSTYLAAKINQAKDLLLDDHA